MPSELDPRPYKIYRSRPQGLLGRLRGEEDVDLPGERDGDRGGAGTPGSRPRFGGGRWRPRPRRVLAYLVLAVVAWLALSLVLFLVSTSQQQSIPASAQAALSPGGNMLTSTDTVLILGTDQRPKGSKEPGAFSSGIRSDTIMLWRVGGGVSRRLSIPRDTLADIPGFGVSKINAAYAYGGPALAIRTVERFTGVKINHIIIVNLAAFPPFIDAIGGVDVKTGRVCSDISGGARNGGWSLYLKPGVHHLTGIQALVYARTRENKCNPHENDLTRVTHQQEILNAIKGRLLSPGTFFHLPWASWEAPKVLRTDMGGFTLLSLFAASELGGSAPVSVLPTSFSSSGTSLVASPGAVRAAVNKLMNG